MRISVSEFDIASRDISAWVRNRLYPSDGGPRLGYDGSVKLAIYRYHKTGDQAQARTHLQALLQRFQNASLRASATALLEDYFRWCDAEQPAVAAVKARLGFPLGNGLILGGEIGRLDLDFRQGGYRAVLLGDAPRNWRDGFRMPLTQRAVAALAQRDESEIRVGFQALDGSNLVVTQYTTPQLDQCERDAREVAQRIVIEWVSQGGTVT